MLKVCALLILEVLLLGGGYLHKGPQHYYGCFSLF